MRSFEKLQRAELERAREKFAGITTRHEGWGVLFEEVMEVLDSIRANDPGEELLRELAQVACVTQRMAEDLGFCDPSDPE